MLEWNFHWNCFKLTIPRLNELKIFLDKFRPDIVSIQELKLCEEDANFRLRFEGYSSFHKLRAVGSKHGGGVAVLIKENIPHTLLQTDYSQLELIGINIDTGKLCFDFFSLYSPPGELIPYEFFIEYSKYNKKFILAGDLNSKTPCIGCRSTDMSGEVLETILTETDLLIFNDNSPTYNKFNSDYEEILDIIIGSSSLANIVSEFKVLEDYSMTSDHFPVSLSLNVSNHSFLSSEFIESRYNFKKADWNLYHGILLNRANSYTKSYIDKLNVDNLNKLVVRDIKEAAEHSIPKFKKKPNKSLPQEIIFLIKKRREIRKLAKNNQNMKTEYNQLTSRIKESINIYSDGKWRQFLDSLGDHPICSRIFWEKINQTRTIKQTSNIPNLKVGEEEYKTDIEKVVLFSDILKKTFSNDEIFNERAKKEIEKEAADFFKVISKLKINISSGDDGINNIF